MGLTRRDFFAALIGSGLAGLGTWSGSTWLISAAPPEVLPNKIEMGRFYVSGSGRTDMFGMRIPLTGPGQITQVVVRYQGHEEIWKGRTGVGDDWVFWGPLKWMDGEVRPLVASFAPLRQEELDQIDSVDIHVQDPGNPGEGPVVWEWKRTQ